MEYNSRASCSCLTTFFQSHRFLGPPVRGPTFSIVSAYAKLRDTTLSHDKELGVQAEFRPLPIPSVHQGASPCSLIKTAALMQYTLSPPPTYVNSKSAVVYYGGARTSQTCKVSPHTWGLDFPR